MEHTRKSKFCEHTEKFVVRMTNCTGFFFLLARVPLGARYLSTTPFGHFLNMNVPFTVPGNVLSPACFLL